MKAGASLAAEDINARGGVLGRQVILKFGDDSCASSRAEGVAAQLVSEKVVFVAGHFCSATSIIAARVYNEEGILQISPASTDPALTDKGYSAVFRVSPSDTQGRFAGDYIADHFANKRTAIVHDKTSYGAGLAAAVNRQLLARGYPPVLLDTISAGQRSYSALVAQLGANKIELLFFAGYSTEAALIVREMRERNISARLMSGDALLTDEFWKVAGAAGSGTLVSFELDPRSKPDAAVVVNRFRQKGIEPHGYTLYTYGAVQVWAEAARRAGTTEASSVAQALRSGKFNTVLGTIRFDAKGDMVPQPWAIYEWQDGLYRQITK